MSQLTVKECILNSAPKSCELDPIPSKLLIECLDSILPSLIDLFNSSLASGIFPQCFKSALVIPILKKRFLDHNDLNNYRPVSNLCFIDKILEKLVLSQVSSYLNSHNLYNTCQSAYHPGHSTETALLKVVNDLFLSLNKGNISVLALLHFSSAFDTIDHTILVHRLHTDFGFTDTVLQWFSSYLTDRTHYVSLCNHCSDFAPVHSGVPVYSYTRTELLSLRTKTSLLSLSTVDRLKDLNIGYHLPRRHRSSRGVKRKKKKFPSFIVASFNAQSVKGNDMACKRCEISTFIKDNGVDLFFVTETWLSAQGDEAKTAELAPSGFDVKSFSRQSRSRGGGIATVYKSTLGSNITFKTNFDFTHTSFEVVQASITLQHNTLHFFCLYRPPPNRRNNLTDSMFTEQLPDLLDYVNSLPGFVCLVGDMNIHFDNPLQSLTKQTLSTLSLYDLVQVINKPTHRCGHIIDWVIVRPDDDIHRKSTVTDSLESDHYCTKSYFNISVDKPSTLYRTVRNIANIDRPSFIAELSSVSEFSSVENANQFCDFLRTVLDKHAPPSLLTALSPWFESIRDELFIAKRERRQAERKWRNTKLIIFKDLYRQAKHKVSKLVHTAKCKFYTERIALASSSKELHQIVNTLSNRHPPKILPTIYPSADLPSIFIKHFTNKVEKLRANFTPDPAEYRDELSLQLDNTRLPTIRNPKILGLTFDPKLTFNEHIKTSKDKAEKTINILKALTSTHWGKNKETLINTYKTVTRPILEYAGTIYAPIISDKQLTALQVTQNQGLRIATGCTSDTNINHIHDETKILPIEKHLRLHSSQLRQKSSHPDHPLHRLTTQPQPPRLKKKTIFNNNQYTLNIDPDPTHAIDENTIKRNMKTIHTTIVQDHLSNRPINKLLNRPPPDIDKKEETLPHSTRRKLSQLRTNKSPLLMTYLHKIDPANHPAANCPLCNDPNHDSLHLFNCPDIPTTLTVWDLWTDPVGVAALLDVWGEKLGGPRAGV